MHDEVGKTVKEMLDAGSRYVNLEKSLGIGVVFILGKDLAETVYYVLSPRLNPAC